jgi:protein transport protein SEC23
MIAENNLPPELAPQFTTIEYTLTVRIFFEFSLVFALQKATTMPPIFLFVVDLCLLPEELKALKESLQTALSLLPVSRYLPNHKLNSRAVQVNALVGLITYGRMVHVHELGVAGMPRAYVFKGAKEVTKEQLQKIVTRPAPGPHRAGGQQTPSTPALGQPPPPGGQMMPPGQQQQRRWS